MIKTAATIMIVVLTVLGAAAPAAAQEPKRDEIVLGTNWVAEAEHGGFYQALADGTYRRYGLDVSILPGGPQADNRVLLMAAKVDFYVSAGMLQAIEAVARGIQTVAIAAIFQKDPQVLMVHPDPALATLADLKPLKIFVSKEGLAGYFQWLKAEYGFTEAQARPYAPDMQPFAEDPRSASQGYVTSEPFLLEKARGLKPKVFLLADHGFDSYSTVIETRRSLVEKRPDIARRFVEASIVGWYNYLYGDNGPANDAIKKDNPEMSDEQIAYAIGKMKEHGIVDSGDAVTLGIGAMTDQRVIAFFDRMVRAGALRPTVDFRRAYTLQFVNRKVGLDLRPRN